MELTLTGGSMRPLLRPGRRARIEALPARRLSPGDIVLYRIEDKLLLHRFAFRTAAGFWIFDDADTVGWHRIKDKAVLGRLRDAGPFSRGLLGLVYAIAMSLGFKLFRLARPRLTTWRPSFH